jgi:hypothetical protein
MKAEDLIPAGDRAKRHLRVAQALAQLSKSRTPSLSQVKEALAKVEGNQPAVAMAVILEYSKRHPLYLRGEWLRASEKALQLYRLSDDADQKEAELARDHINHEIESYNAEMERLETLRERLSMGMLSLLLLLMVGTLIYIGYSFNSKPEGEELKADKPASAKTDETNKAVAKPDAKTDVGKKADKKPDEKRETDKAPAPETKKADKDAKPTKPAGK